MTTTTLTAIVKGVSYNLTDGSLCWREAEDGLGMADSRRLSERGPYQHGSSDRGFRLEPRNIQLVLGVAGETEADMYNKRAQLLRIFRPSDSPIQLRYELSNGKTYQIDCFYSGKMTLPSSERQGFSQRIGIELYAPDPTFYKPELTLVVFGLSGAGGAFNVPMAVPTGVGSSVLDSTKTIRYEGTWREYPIIKIVGPITNPVIENVSTGEKLDFTGTTIDNGDYYVVDCRYGYKTVTDSAGNNRIDRLSVDSDLATFHLAADDELADGANDIRVTGSGINTSSEVYIQFNERYIGF